MSYHVLALLLNWIKFIPIAHVVHKIAFNYSIKKNHIHHKVIMFKSTSYHIFDGQHGGVNSKQHTKLPSNHTTSITFCMKLANFHNSPDQAGDSLWIQGICLSVQLGGVCVWVVCCVCDLVALMSPSGAQLVWFPLHIPPANPHGCWTRPKQWGGGIVMMEDGWTLKAPFPTSIHFWWGIQGNRSEGCLQTAGQAKAIKAKLYMWRWNMKNMKRENNIIL